MPILPKVEFDPIEYLVQRKFPLPLSNMATKYGGTGPFGLQAALAPTPINLSEEAVYRRELEKMPQSELVALVAKERLAYELERGDALRKLKEKEESERPFNSGEALEVDYAYWAKMGTLEWDEVTALSLARNPLVVKPSMLDDYRYRDSPFVKAYAQRRELIKRSALWGGTCITSPRDFYEWAKKYHIDLPAGFVEQLETFANPRDWKKAFDGVDKKREELEARVRELEVLSAAIPSKADKELSTNERNTLMKILYGMAKSEYGYTPGVKGTTASDIEKAVTDAGLSVDVDTVRKWLKIAADYCKEQGAD